MGTNKTKITSKLFFLNDDDGFSSRDFVLVATVSMYFILFIYCIFSLIMYREIPSGAFDLFEATDSIIITVVGGTMGVVGIEKYVASRKKPEESPSKNDTPDGVNDSI